MFREQMTRIKFLCTVRPLVLPFTRVNVEVDVTDMWTPFQARELCVRISRLETRGDEGHTVCRPDIVEVMSMCPTDNVELTH